MHNDLSQLKKEARHAFRKQRDELPSAYLKAASEGLCAHAWDWIKAMKSRGSPISKICAFLQTGSEPDLTNLMERLSPEMVIGLPRVTGKSRMEFRSWRPGDPTALNQFGIPEPVLSATLVEVDPATLILIPALAVSRSGYRLGYGGGYYDRFLSEAPPCLKVAVTYNAFISDQLPTEAHDIPVDFILTESGLAPSIPSRTSAP